MVGPSPWAAEPSGQWGRVPIIFWKFLAISKNIRQRSLRQMVQKLLPIMMFDNCKALLNLAMKVLGFFLSVNSYLSSISTFNWFYLKLQLTDVQYHILPIDTFSAKGQPQL